MENCNREISCIQLLQQRYGAGEARALYELVMRRRFGLSRTDILLGKDTTLSSDDKEELQRIIDRIAKGEPVQYVLGSEEFCGREFFVGPGVLIPRPETQQLVRLLQQNVAPGSRVLDVGTGCGCIAITLALAGYQVTALDVSEEALAYARRNAERHGAMVEFLKVNILEQGARGKEQEDCYGRLSSLAPCSLPLAPCSAIVSNPPYICESEATEMDDNVLLHEPHLALFVPDDNPLLFYHAIADFGLRHLAQNGWLFFETNRAYPRQVADLLSLKGYNDTKTIKDQYDNERFVCARKK